MKELKNGQGRRAETRTVLLCRSPGRPHWKRLECRLCGSVPVNCRRSTPGRCSFGNPEIAGVNLSPDGRWIAFLAPDQGVLNLCGSAIWMAKSKPGMLAQQRDRPQRPRVLDGRPAASADFIRDGDGDENAVLVRIDPRTGQETRTSRRPRG